jgi:hypothetical protein
MAVQVHSSPLGTLYRNDHDPGARLGAGFSLLVHSCRRAVFALRWSAVRSSQGSLVRGSWITASQISKHGACPAFRSDRQQVLPLRQFRERQVEAVVGGTDWTSLQRSHRCALFKGGLPLIVEDAGGHRDVTRRVDVSRTTMRRCTAPPFRERYLISSEPHAHRLRQVESVEVHPRPGRCPSGRAASTR